MANSESRLTQVFAARKAAGETTFVAYCMAACPTPEATVDAILGMEAGGADIVELGVPHTDPIADGPAIQIAGTLALSHSPPVDFSMCLEYIRQARSRGGKAGYVLMTYCNMVLQYGELKAIQDAKAAGVDGFIIVDLPPEEAVHFREMCKEHGMSYIPLIAPSTTDSRIQFLGEIADSFIYVVSNLGVTGVRATVSGQLAPLLERIRRLLPNSNIPLAVGFGVSNADHFNEIGLQAEGVVVGSKLVTMLCQTKPSDVRAVAKRVCQDISGGVDRKPQSAAGVKGTMGAVTNVTGTSNGTGEPTIKTTRDASVPTRFGEFGGQYVPEALVSALDELEAAHRAAMADPAFLSEFESYFGYINRPSQLYQAKRISEQAGGAQIWFKREDLNHTGSHKINNAIGQILLARRIGKRRIIAETGAGQHGVATATVCAKFGLECVIYMGAEDVRRQALNVFRIKMLGARVVPVTSGSQTLKDAINEAMRDWVSNLSTSHYLVGSAIGPHPFPTLVRDFQSIIGKEIRKQMLEQVGKLPDALVACVGGGSNAIGTFHTFIGDANVRLIGVEAAGDGLDTDRHSATLTKGTKGVLHGVRTYLLQNESGQINETHSISAGLDYPGVGPEHSYLKDMARAEYVAATDEQALRGFRMCSQLEGIIPALESSHAIWATVELAKTMPKHAHIVMCLSGRGDKDVQEVYDILPKWADRLDWHISA